MGIDGNMVSTRCNAVSFGCDFNGLAEDGMYSAFETVTTTLANRTGQLPGSQFLPTEGNRKYDRALQKLDTTVEEIVQARAKQLSAERSSLQVYT